MAEKDKNINCYHRIYNHTNQCSSFKVNWAELYYLFKEHHLKKIHS